MNAQNSNDIDAMFDAYVECALWSESAGIVWNDETASFDFDENDDRSFLDHNFDTDDIDSVTLREMRGDVSDFAEHNSEDLANMTAEQAGHDFWLTRNGHGAGFWDRGLGEIGERLSRESKPYGSYSLYMGDDGKVYGQ